LQHGVTFEYLSDDPLEKNNVHGLPWSHISNHVHAPVLLSLTAGDKTSLLYIMGWPRTSLEPPPPSPGYVALQVREEQFTSPTRPGIFLTRGWVNSFETVEN
jgi:hypothetical protein